MLKQMWAKITWKPSHKHPQVFHCLTPYLNSLDPIENPHTRIRDGQKEREAGRDRRTGKTIWLPLSD